VVSVLAEPERLALRLAGARRTYTPFEVRLADARSRAWSARSESPYAGAVAEVGRATGRPGAFLLNCSDEWGCTTGAAEDPVNGGATLLRTLDWPFDGLGRAVVVVRQRGREGEYLNVTWPGFAGVWLQQTRSNRIARHHGLFVMQNRLSPSGCQFPASSMLSDY